MSTQTFAITTSPFTFTLETDDGELVSLTAVDGDDKVYDCLLQLMPREAEGETFCCRPSSCTGGSCIE